MEPFDVVEHVGPRRVACSVDLAADPTERLFSLARKLPFGYPPTPSFGAMLFDGSGARTFQAHPHVLLVPGIIVTLLLYAFVLLGDAINDVIADR